MTVSAIVCVHQNLAWLPEALASIAGQSAPVSEVILVKSKETPAGADELAKRFGVKKMAVQEEPGLAAARNLGIRLASGNAVAFLDSDDVWEKNKTEVQTNLLETESLDCVIGCLRRFPEGPLNGQLYSEAHFLETVPALTPGGVLVRKAVFEKTGCFDSSYRIACDHEWFMRLLETSLRLKKIPDVVLRKRIHAANLSNGSAAYRQEIMQVLKNRNR
jgi:glycosyltransferase involved in cell wall biosynthesis